MALVVKYREGSQGSPVFKAVPGSRLSDDDAAIVGERLFEIAGDSQAVTPEAVVADARPPRSRLHRFFTWNDRRAAELQRLSEARMLLRSVAIVVHGPDGKEAMTRGFHALRVATADGGSDKVYLTARYVFENQGAADQVIAMARAEMESWLRRFEMYSYLRRAAVHAKKAVRVLAKAKKGRRSAVEARM